MLIYLNKSFKYLTIFFSFVLFASTFHAYAATYYISTTGSDTNSGTQALPWKTIQKAAGAMRTGDTALVQPGTYSGQISISTSGITLQAEGKVVTKNFDISGNSNTVRGFTITDPASDWGIRTTGNNNLIEKNEIYHTKQDGVWFFGSYNIFRGNYIHDILDPSILSTHVDCFQTWGWDWNTTNVLIENNTCINNSNTEYENQIIQADRTTTAEVRDITFRNNVFIIYKPTFGAITWWWSAGWPQVSNVTVVNNTVVNMTRDRRAEGITFNNVAGTTAINNLFINFGDIQTPYIEVVMGSNPNIHHNAVYNVDGIAPKGSPYIGDVWMKDPKIVSLSGLDFHLQATSPLIDAGYNLGSLVPTDINGVSRAQGAGYDIGAYEYTSGSTPTPTVTPTPIPTLTPTPTVTPTPTPTVTPKLGDANGDGLVNETDYGIWLSNYNKSGTLSSGDFNSDSFVDGADYVIWAKNFGK